MFTIPRPMLASPMRRGIVTNWSDWAIEEKFDGHRLIVVVDAGVVTAYARPRGDGATHERVLPDRVVDALRALPACGVFDGELVARDGESSSDVTRLDRQDDLRLVVFDVLSIAGVDATRNTYQERHAVLQRIIGGASPAKLNGRVELAPSFAVASQEDVERFVRNVWERGGEGAILKRRASTYQAGKRSSDWIKVKKVLHATLTVIGFERSKGTVRFPGHPFAIVRLRDDRGNETTVKTKDDHELKTLEREWDQRAAGVTMHPALGRRLVIEYQDRTADGNYRHPRWDRWAEEEE